MRWLCLVLLAAACVERDPEVDRRCGSDADCILVEDTTECCLSCRQLTAEEVTAIRADAQDEWHDARCDPATLCPACIGGMPSDVRAACSQGQCVVAPNVTP